MWGYVFITCGSFLQGYSSIHAMFMQVYTWKCNSCTLYQFKLESLWRHLKSVSRKPKVCSTTIYLYAWLLLLCCCAGSAGLSRKGSYRYPVSPRLRAKYIKFSYDMRFEFPSEMNVEFKVIFFTKIMWQRKNSAACRTGIKMEWLLLTNQITFPSTILDHHLRHMNIKYEII